MLLRFAVSNFRSFEKQQEFSLVSTALKDRALATAIPGLRTGALPVAALYGANASGKTNVLRALSFVRSAVVNSQTSWKPQQRIPRESFRMRLHSADRPSEFELDFVVDGVRFEYNFAVDEQQVLAESLRSYPEGRPRMLYSRERDKFSFGKFATGPNQTIQQFVRPNSLFLSAAAQYNHEVLAPIYNWFARHMRFVFGHRDELSADTIALCSDHARRPILERMLQVADFGLAGIEFKSHELDEQTKKVFAALRSALPEDVGDLNIEFPEAFPAIAFKHQCEDGRQVKFSQLDESSGTLAYFGLLGPIIETLARGGILFVDELEKSLHPHLALRIVDAFSDRTLNTRGAQIVFSTHDTNLLAADVLRRDQIWFTEKDRCGATHLYPLTDFAPRREENFERGYMQGRYGAIPFIDREQFHEILSKVDANVTTRK